MAKNNLSKGLNSDIDAILSKLNSEIGGFTILDSEINDESPRVSSGIDELDRILGGGFPEGRLIEIYGEESSGKTWVLSKTYAANQKLGKICAHYDVECSYHKIFASQNGVQIDKLLFKQPDTYAENILQEIEKLCKTGIVSIIGVDSVSSLIPKDELEGDIEDLKMAPLARVMSKAIKKLTNIAASTGTTIIFINQTRTDIGKFSPMGTPTTTPGGKALKFHASIRLQVSKMFAKKQDYPDLYDSIGEPLGHVLKCKTIKNKTFPPLKECETILRYIPKNNVEQIIDKAFNSGVLDKQKRDHRKIKYKEYEFTIEEKNNPKMIFDNLSDNGKIFSLIFEIGEENKIEELIKSGDLSQEKYNEFIKK